MIKTTNQFIIWELKTATLPYCYLVPLIIKEKVLNVFSVAQWLVTRVLENNNIANNVKEIEWSGDNLVVNNKSQGSMRDNSR